MDRDSPIQPKNHGVRHVSDTLVSWRQVSSSTMTFSRRYSRAMTLADVVAGDHKNRKVVAREHLSTVLKRALLVRRVLWAASRVCNHASFRLAQENEG